MPSTHRTYDKDFRQEAVNLLLSSGRPLKRVAAELGVTPNSLVLQGFQWVSFCGLGRRKGWKRTMPCCVAITQRCWD